MTVTDLNRSDSTRHSSAEDMKVFTVVCGGERLGLPIASVQTIFRVGKVTPVPKSAPEIIGLINLRGKINTAASLRRVLGMSAEGEKIENALAICIEHRSEHFALVIDEIGDVIAIPESARIEEPPNVDSRRAAVTSGVYRLEDEILPVLDVDALLDFGKSPQTPAASRYDGERQ